MKKFYITTPIYYTNSSPHVGSAYTTILADVLARWNRLKGFDVFFLTGTDEHGQKIQETAEEKGLNPKEFVDKIAEEFKDSFKLLNISNDNFIRTTDKEHEKEVKKILQELYNKKYIYKGFYESYYCVGCEQYITESDLVDGKCPLHNGEPELRKEEAYMFKLSKFQGKLLNLIKSGKYSILPVKRRKEIISFIETGLKDISISRLKKQVYWGIELPFDKDHTCFVWLDAFWNYITGLKEKNKFNTFWPPNVQLMAQDIIRVHSTIWPALLLATGNKLPNALYVHGYFTINGKKMSKSLGNVISPEYLVKQYSADTLRYYLIREIPFGQDGDFSEESLKARHNNELANDLGNLVSRVLTLVDKNFKSGLKKSPLDKKLISKLNIKKIDSHMQNLELQQALNETWKFINECNKHINDERPWELKGKELEKHLYTLAESVRIIAILVSSFIPSTADKIFEQLNQKKGNLKDAVFGKVKIYKVKKGEILFKKIVLEEKTNCNEIKYFSIEPQLKKDGINVCMAFIKNIGITNKNSKIEQLKKETANKIIEDRIKTHDILNGYKEFYNKVELNDCMPAAENLIKIVKKNGRFPNINTVVDCYNVVSAETGLSFGAHDTDRIEGDLRFKLTNGSEKFVPLGEKDSIKINKGEYAFMDNKEILCRLDIKQCDKTKITKNTMNIIIYAQGNRNVNDDYLKNAVVKVCETLKSIYNCDYKILGEK